LVLEIQAPAVWPGPLTAD